MDASSPISQGPEDRRRVSPTWLAAGFAAVLVVAALGYGLLAQPGSQLAPGSPVPDFQLSALDGTPMILAAQRGNVVVVNFFASWCDPCRQEAAALEATWRDYQGQGVQFFGIAYKDVESAAKAFMTEFGVSYPTAVEAGNRTSRLYGVTGVPETFVVDQNGNLVHHFLGAVTRAELAQVINPLLAR